MYHRMLNDKFMLFEKALLARSPVTDGYRHQIIGYASWLSAFTKRSPFQRSRRESHATGGAAGSVTTQEAIKGKSSSVSSSSSPQPQNSSSPPYSSDKHTLVDKVGNASSSISSSYNSGNGRAGSAASLEKHAGKGYPLPSSSLLSSNDLPRVFPELRVAFDCGRNCEKGLNQEDVCSDFFSTFFSPGVNSNDSFSSSNILGNTTGGKNRAKSNSCLIWRDVAGQKVTSLVRSLDAASAVLQSPLVPPSRE